MLAIAMLAAAAAAPSPPRVHPFPQYDRAAGPCGKSDPRHRRQLCDPQTSKGAPLAGAASPLDVPLHPDLSILAQRGRRLLRQAHAPAPQARRVPICHGSAGRHQPLRRRDKPQSQTLRLDRRPKTRARRRQTGEANVRVSPLARSLSE